MKSQYYSINGKEYHFKNLVIGQYRQLAELEFEVSEDIDNKELFKTLISKLSSSKIMAIVLAPVNFHISEKEIDKLENEIEFEFTPEQLEIMVNDFFAFCPLEKLLEDMMRVAKSGQRLRPLI